MAVVRHLLSIDDLTDPEISTILARARHFEETPSAVDSSGPVVAGLLFGQTSLRTRVGFASAVSRLGWSYVDIFERRHDATSMVESWADTLRTVAGYVDVLVGRPGDHLPRDLISDVMSIPYINAGATGPGAEHPTQALIDTYAIESELGALDSLSVALVGDLRMRAARSLLRVFARRPPRRLILSTLAALDDELPPGLAARAEYRPLSAVGDVDVLYVIGVPHQAVPERERDALRVTTAVLDGLSPKAIVLSPLPVIDEIDPAARTDERVRMFEQSDRGLFVRMAVLEAVVSRWPERRPR